jgi:hypothetical protein
VAAAGLRNVREPRQISMPGNPGTSESKHIGASEISAEGIAGRPAGASHVSGLYAPDQSGSVSFTSYTATVSGTTGGIGSFATVHALATVHSSAGAPPLASVSALTGGSAFAVAWKQRSGAETGLVPATLFHLCTSPNLLGLGHYKLIP